MFMTTLEHVKNLDGTKHAEERRWHIKVNIK